MRQVLALAAIASAVAFSQEFRASISGTVTDPSASLIAGAKIAITEVHTGTKVETVSDTAGHYHAPFLLPGDYDVSVKIDGFREFVRKGLHLGAGENPAIDVKLEVGATQQLMEVSDTVPLINSENASIGTVIENRSIVELPLNGRNYLQLTSLIPGATTNGPSSSQGKQRMGGQRNSFALNVAGQRVHFNHYSLDGVENTDLNFNSYMLLPSVDALEEFNIVSGLFDAEYGRAIAQVNVSTKSGSNAFRGTVFEFLRHSSLDAKNFFDRQDLPIPPFKRNQYGFTLSGPVVLPRWPCLVL